MLCLTRATLELHSLLRGSSDVLISHCCRLYLVQQPCSILFTSHRCFNCDVVKKPVNRGRKQKEPKKSAVPKGKAYEEWLKTCEAVAKRAASRDKKARLKSDRVKNS